MCGYVCARASACVCAYVRACVCVLAGACTRDDTHVYACGAHVGAHVGALAGAGSRTCGCTCVRARVCMYDYYIILLYVQA